MAEKAGEDKARGSRARGQAAVTTRRTQPMEGEDRGSLALRRPTSEYRAAAEEQAARVREEIEAALLVARDTREAIERRIADELHAPPGSFRARAQQQKPKQRRTAARKKKSQAS
ncbi:hypothetical protein OWM54_20110 [Myxococcus sp. MISCRS1]|uniref:hypothetical protein n=1 Tax=Myxococcus TaxID=32 RepID=UPI00226E06EB|nr:hypothetical protein [Myxococcus sp. MISCRS1]MCY0999445.1 hypothetical protein [Myxococcus sp. MISCRS1]BDT30550.1 hypothetical protein MFMH1_02190 [Myxococcus sp. MH1]